MTAEFKNNVLCEFTSAELIEELVARKAGFILESGIFVQTPEMLEIVGDLILEDGKWKMNI